MIKSKSALLIDDDRNTLTILQSELLKLGYIVTAINHPSRVDETLERMNQIDVIFLDLEMPVKSGFEVLQHIKEMDIDAPIIAHTVHVDYLISEFPSLLSYNRFIQLMPRIVTILCDYLQWCYGSCTGLALLDSTSLKVCHNRRISNIVSLKMLLNVGEPQLTGSSASNFI